jgi:hypothetical protein
MVLHFVNAGSSPAFHVRLYAHHTLMKRGEGLPDDAAMQMRDEPNHLSVGTVATGNLTPPLSGRITLKGVDDATYANLQSGDQLMYVFGLLTYEDQFQIQRSTTFCFRFVPSSDGPDIPTPFCPNNNELK